MFDRSRIWNPPKKFEKIRSTEVGFEPTHALHIGLAGQRLNHSAILPPQLR
jgi:hypothetical protein